MDIVQSADSTTAVPANPSADFPISQDVSKNQSIRIALRKHYPTRKAAEQAARKARGGKPPKIHPPEGRKPPHFHPNVEQAIKDY